MGIASTVVVLLLAVPFAAAAPPTAEPDAASVAEDSLAGVAIAVLGNDTDPELGALTIGTFTQPANGVVTENVDQTLLQYVPNAQFNGTDTFTYTAEDPASEVSAPAPVTVTVTEVNDPPTANDDEYAVPPSPATTLAVLANDTSGPGNESSQALTVTPTLVTAPTSGTAIVNSDNTITYTPNGAFLGSDSFVYEVCDNGTTASSADPECDEGTVTVDVQPQISIANVTVTEGNAGTVDAIFDLTLSPADTSPVTVDFTTANGSASAGTDYVAKAETVSFPASSTTQQIIVTVNGDTLDEIDEAFLVNLAAPTNALLLDSQGTGTITDDDAAPSLSIADVTVIEGNAGAKAAELQVSLSALSGKTVTVAYATANGAALTPSDYQAASGTLTFTPGEVLKPVVVNVVGDRVVEPDEAFLVDLSSPVNATISDARAIATIRNDDTGGCDITGTAGADTLTGTAADETICGLGGNDKIDGGGGSDLVIGGAGNDSISGAAGDDTISGGAGNDQIDGGTGDDAIDGDAGNDTMTGGAGGDAIEGGAGNDRLYGSQGNDTISGDGGNDLAQGGGDEDTMDAGAGNDNFAGNDGDDRVDGGAGSDRVLGDAGNDWVNAGYGNDPAGAHGGPGNDIVRGESGDDLLTGGTGNDTFQGEGGTDVVAYVSSRSGVTVDLTRGRATGEGRDGISTVENVTGSRFRDTLIGNSAANVLGGGGGHDRIYGRASRDHLLGGPGNDLLRGEAGFDTLVGSSGRDDCDAGPGGGRSVSC